MSWYGRVSLFQRHHLHSLAVHGDCAVRYPGGHRGHGHLHRPVALGEAGYHSLVHAHGDLDQSWGDKGETSGWDRAQLPRCWLGRATSPRPSRAPPSASCTRTPTVQAQIHPSSYPRSFRKTDYQESKFEETVEMGPRAGPPQLARR